MSSNDLQSYNEDRLEHSDRPSEQAFYHVLATLVAQAINTWQATFRLAVLFAALALPASAILILCLLIR